MDRVSDNTASANAADGVRNSSLSAASLHMQGFEGSHAEDVVEPFSVPLSEPLHAFVTWSVDLKRISH